MCRLLGFFYYFLYKRHACILYIMYYKYLPEVVIILLTMRCFIWSNSYEAISNRIAVVNVTTKLYVARVNDPIIRRELPETNSIFIKLLHTYLSTFFGCNVCLFCKECSTKIMITLLMLVLCSPEGPGLISRGQFISAWLAQKANHTIAP